MDAFATGPAADRRDLFLETANRRGVSPVIIEKDFWVCWALRQVTALERLGPQLIFKGGTSLSKVFHLIERFSEDLDLSLQRSYLGFAGATDPEQAGSATQRRKSVLSLREACRECVRRELLPALTARFTTILGDDGWTLAVDAEDSGTLNFVYPSAAPTRRGQAAGSWLPLPYIRGAVKLEFGAGSDPYPVGTYPVVAYAAEAFPQLFTEPPGSVTVLQAERTFWEKATLIHAEYHRPAERSTPPRISRHFYDLQRLAASEYGVRALADRQLLRRVVEHKQVYFASGWARYETAATGGLHLLPPTGRLPELKHDYLQMQEMFFGPFPRFEEILASLAALETEINGR